MLFLKNFTICMQEVLMFTIIITFIIIMLLNKKKYLNVKRILNKLFNNEWYLDEIHTFNVRLKHKKISTYKLQICKSEILNITCTYLFNKAIHVYTDIIFKMILLNSNHS